MINFVIPLSLRLLIFRGALNVHMQIIYLTLICLQYDEAAMVRWFASLRASQGGCMLPCSLGKIGVSSLFPKDKLTCSLKFTYVKLPCSQKFSVACSLDPQKYSLMLPKIPIVFQFLTVSYGP